MRLLRVLPTRIDGRTGMDKSQAADVSFAQPSALGTAHLEALAAQLAEEMAECWHQGQRPWAEEFLNRHPQLWKEPQAATQLIYEEICLRQSCGEKAAADEVVRRFPQWQKQLQILLACHQLIEPGPAAPVFPGVGETLGDFRIAAELGRGAVGRVFLANQLSLDNRQVVLKVAPCTAREQQEHLSLARLQHTHIVPLYALQDYPERNLRVLCMPYFGGTTFDRLLAKLGHKAPAQRTGRDLLDALDLSQSASAVALPAKVAARPILAEASYVRAVCMIGVCVADALHYAHSRDLLHLDLKPANLLLAADGQPMLLDFHLAQGPIKANGPPPKRLGGTPLYMSPEQEKAVAVIRQDLTLPMDIDGRSDIYSLGLTLYQLLGGPFPVDIRAPSQLRRYNPQVSVGLADILQKSMNPRPQDRYIDAAALSAELERHLHNQSLRGVPNRSLSERWSKWRRRQPLAVAKIGILLVVLSAALTLGTVFYQRSREVETALAQGKVYLQEGKYPEAVATLEHGRSLAQELRFFSRMLPGSLQVLQELDEQLPVAEQARARADAAARRARAARDLHHLADDIRFQYSVESLPLNQRREIGSRCRTLWSMRRQILEGIGERPTPEVEQIRTDLVDLGIIWADLCVRLGLRKTLDEARQEALGVLAEMEEEFGPSAVLYVERQQCADALGLKEQAESARLLTSRQVVRTPWEHYALGRFLLRSGKLESAAGEFERALDLEPLSFWPNFYRGLCAYRRQRYEQAINAFSVCVGLAPEPAKCFFNRALAYEALQRFESALQDYDRALKIDRDLAAAYLNRGLLHLRAKRYGQARADFHKALEKGADREAVQRNLDLIQKMQKASKSG